MELRVWVDGAQRVVCGVKLTTTCQEIVFALAHATQQAGRFTMIERWRNNERLLSPNEQPLVTLQRWGERMNEVEFILRKTSTDHPPPSHVDRTSSGQLPSNHNQQVPQIAQLASANSVHPEELSSVSNDNEPLSQPTLTNGQQNSPSNKMTAAKQPLHNHQQVPENIFNHNRQYNPTRRPQTVLGPLTSSNSALNLGSNYVPNQMSRFSNSFRPSLSASTLPSLTNNMTASPSNPVSLLRSRYSDDNAIQATSPSGPNGEPQNGYSIQSENQQFHIHPSQARPSPQNSNFPHEDLYSTINKKRTNHIPPIVPAKPRLVPPINNTNHPQQSLTSIKNAQMNYYQPNQNSLVMYTNNIRPRNPPGYLEYLEAMANRNSLPAALLPNSSYSNHNHFLQSNMFPRQVDQQQVQQQNGMSPASSSNSNCFQVNGQTAVANLNQKFDTSGSSAQNLSQISSKFVESSGVVINRGSAVNVRLPSNSQPASCVIANTTYENLNSSTPSNNSSVSQIGHDMLKVIEEQKRVLMNQKTELDRLDNDQEYLEARQNSEQAELINRIENEIRQLEELWSENQAQIKKLENQDFERELGQLKSEQARMEHDITNQKKKLSLLESDINKCQNKIAQLEAELCNSISGSDESIQEDARLNDQNPLPGADLRSTSSEFQPNGTSEQNPSFLDRESNCSEDEDYEDDSGGDASDDLNTNLPDSKLRNAKEVPYVDKRGLISGIRSLKLDKSRSLNKSIESVSSNDTSLQKVNNSTSPKFNDPPSNGNNNAQEDHRSDLDSKHPDDKTANSNKYEFLMKL